MKICIDAGHGGDDSGAVGKAGLEEAPTALSISYYVNEGLMEKGYITLMTRMDDEFVELGDRCEIANDWEADYFVSIHLNSNGSTARGIETLYTSDKGKALAAPIQRKLVEVTKDTDRGLKYRDDLYVLNGTYMPAILVEVGFISHPDTEVLFNWDDYKRMVAEAIVDGIVEHLPLGING
jgi:N-acetylmuramoyl-L-alanine amidase